MKNINNKTQILCVFTAGICVGVGTTIIANHIHDEYVKRRKNKAQEEIMKRCGDIIQTFMCEAKNITKPQQSRKIKVYKGDGVIEEHIVENGKVIK